MSGMLRMMQIAPCHAIGFCNVDQMALCFVAWEGNFVHMCYLTRLHELPAADEAGRDGSQDRAGGQVKRLAQNVDLSHEEAMAANRAT